MSVNWQEIEFVRAYTDIQSPTFANGYRSGIAAGYSVSYSRNIRSHYSSDRILRIQCIDQQRVVIQNDAGDEIEAIEVERPREAQGIRMKRSPSHVPLKELSRALDKFFDD